jgi:hypothetical protein
MSLNPESKAQIYSTLGPDCEGDGHQPINGIRVTLAEETALGAQLAAELEEYKAPREIARQTVTVAFADAQIESSSQ